MHHPQADLDWSSVVHLGGRARALDRRMPAFGEALSDSDICRQIAGEALGTPASFTGGYLVDAAPSLGSSHAVEARPIFGPFEADKGLTAVMHSATGFRQTEASHDAMSTLSSEILARASAVSTMPSRDGASRANDAA